MSTAMTMQLNIEESKRGLFCRVPRCFYKKGYAPTTVLVLGKIFSARSQAEQGREEKSCRLSYAQARSEFGVSAPTLSNAFKTLKNNGEIKIVQRDKLGSAYGCIEDYDGKKYDVLPEYLFKAEFLIAGKMRRLTNAELRLLAHIMTLASYKKNDGAAEGSSRVFARTLNLSEKTVRSAIKTLLKAGLIYRRKEEKGVNAHLRSKYRPNEKLYDYKKAIKKKRKTATSQLPAAVQAANARTDRERYYAQQQEENQRRAERYMRLANANPRFTQIDRQLRILQLNVAREELIGGNTYKATEQALRAEKAALLAEMEIRPEWLKAENFCACQKCKDTGYLPNGRACNCYKKE